MKYFVISDVHGFYKEMIAALESAGFDKNNENHTLVVCGDLCDRGSKPRECIEYVMSCPQKHLVCGNHEVLMEEMIARGYAGDHDIHNGTDMTACALTGEPIVNNAIAAMAHNELWKSYFSSLELYYETKNYVFIHGWIPCTALKVGHKKIEYMSYEDWHNAPYDAWMTCMWTNGMDAWAHGIKADKTVVCGHWNSSWGHCHLHHNGLEFPNKFSTNPEHKTAHFSPFIDDGIVAIDACTAFSHKVNCVVIEDEDEEA